MQVILFVGLSACMAISYKVWFTKIAFPRQPILDFILPQELIIGGSVLLLGLFVWYLFKFSSLFLPMLSVSVIIGLYLIDLHLLQPWLWMTMSFLLMLIPFAKRYYYYQNLSTILKSMQIYVALIYIFSGMHKINPYYLDLSVEFYLRPLTGYLWQIRDEILKVFSISAYVEIALGIGLLFSLISPWVKFALIAMHLFVLAMLGPFGLNFNPTLWPWNIQLILLLLVLFPRNQEPFKVKWRIFINTRPFNYILVGSILLFALTKLNLANPYTSFDLYSGTNFYPNAKVLKNDVKQIPHYMNDAYIFGDSLQVNYFDIYFYDYLIPPCPSPRCKERTPEQLVERLKRE